MSLLYTHSLPPLFCVPPLPTVAPTHGPTVHSLPPPTPLRAEGRALCSLLRLARSGGVPALDGRGMLAVASLRRCGASGFSELWARGGAQDLSLAGWTEGVIGHAASHTPY